MSCHGLIRHGYCRHYEYRNRARAFFLRSAEALYRRPNAFEYACGIDTALNLNCGMYAVVIIDLDIRFRAQAHSPAIKQRKLYDSGSHVHQLVRCDKLHLLQLRYQILSQKRFDVVALFVLP